MNLPEGEVLDRSVVSDLGETLADVLAIELTGYLCIEDDTALLTADYATILTVEAGIPIAASKIDGDGCGATALADAAVADLYRLERHALTPEEFESILSQDDEPEAVIPPGLPAEQLAGDNDLADRTRAAAPATHPGLDDESNQMDAVTSFLDDEETIASIRGRARSEARERADEWGFAVDGDGPGESPNAPNRMDDECC